MSAANGATIERRIRINRPDHENARYKVSRASDRHKFSLKLPLLVALCREQLFGRSGANHGCLRCRAPLPSPAFRDFVVDHLFSVLVA